MNQVANISKGDARSLVIQPWEKSMLQHIERAIRRPNAPPTPHTVIISFSLLSTFPSTVSMCLSVSSCTRFCLAFD